MLADERRRRIVQFVEMEGSVSVDDLAQRFDVSEMTIRRDLRTLENRGLIRRVHGGATNARGRSYEPPFLLRKTEHVDAKAAIGQKAADMVEDGDSVALDVGTTTLELARHLEGKQNLTVITPSLHIANLLASYPSLRLILAGGILRPGELSLVGPLTEHTFQQFYADKLFLGIGGISFEAGLTEFNLEDAQTKRVMLQCAKECIVVADASKFDQVAFAAVGPLSIVHKIVTDSRLDSRVAERLREMDIEIVIG